MQVQEASFTSDSTAQGKYMNFTVTGRQFQMVFHRILRESRDGESN